MVEREKELVTVEVAMLSRCSEVNSRFQSLSSKKVPFSFSYVCGHKGHSLIKKEFLPYVYGHKGHSLIKNKLPYVSGHKGHSYVRHGIPFPSKPVICHILD